MFVRPIVFNDVSLFVSMMFPNIETKLIYFFWNWPSAN